MRSGSTTRSSTEYPGKANVWMSYGHALKTAGRQPDSIAAYRRSIELEPGLGEAYWSLANLKTFRFTSDDVAAMRAQLAARRPGRRGPFSLPLRARQGARGRAASTRDSFEHYAEGNGLRRSRLQYDADADRGSVRRARALYTREFFAARRAAAPRRPTRFSSSGCPAPARRWSSRSCRATRAVEGTMELPDVVGDRVAPQRSQEVVRMHPRIRKCSSR